MQDQPTAPTLVAVVAAFLRDSVLPTTSGRVAYDLRVAINALELSAREVALAPRQNADEQARLCGLLGIEGSLDALNRTFCDRIRDGSIGPDTPGVADHLWRTTLDKLAIDQPTYAAYRDEMSSPTPQT